MFSTPTHFHHGFTTPPVPPQKPGSDAIDLWIDYLLMDAVKGEIPIENAVKMIRALRK
jgi:hypothetical protein